MSRPIITLTTDFGTSDSYVAQMKGVILGINPAARIVDVTHAVPPQDVLKGATILDEIIDSFPMRTIHVAVIDPGVGSDRKLVAVEMGNHRFVAPDNGLLSIAARRYPPTRIVSLTNVQFWRSTVSSTFHGRDILAPVAAHWSLGVDAAQFGEELCSLVKLNWAELTREEDCIRGEVTGMDQFGNLATSIPKSWIDLAAAGRTTVECSGRTISGLCTHYAEVDSGELIALFGSSDRLEIAIRNGNAARAISASVGTPVIVRWS